MFCRKCGNEMMDEDRYCLRCGHDQTLPGKQTETGSIFDGDNSNQDVNNYSNEKHTNYQGIIIGVIVFLVVCYIVVNIGTAIFAGAMVNKAGSEVRSMHNTVIDAMKPVEFD